MKFRPFIKWQNFAFTTFKIKYQVLGINIESVTKSLMNVGVSYLNNKVFWFGVMFCVWFGFCLVISNIFKKQKKHTIIIVLKGGQLSQQRRKELFFIKGSVRWNSCQHEFHIALSYVTRGFHAWFNFVPAWNKIYNSTQIVCIFLISYWYEIKTGVYKHFSYQYEIMLAWSFMLPNTCIQ